MKHILILGAGQSTPALVGHLLQHAEEQDWFVTVCDRDGGLAHRRVAGHGRGTAIALDANDSATRAALISKAQVVINMLTRPYQYPIALECLNNGAHMLSASYEDPRVATLDADAHRKNLLILNELGLDPGIDHMIAMSLIQRIRAANGLVTSLWSYGGGLPAPEAHTNPLRYTITWNPRNVLMAGEDGAVYKEEGKIKMLPFHQVFQRTWTVDVEGLGTFEAYPNRDALAYEKELGLHKDHTIIRATLRYPGWSETWQQIVHLGLANEVLRVPNLSSMTYREMTEMFLPQLAGRAKLEHEVANYLGISPTGTIMQNLKFLGLFSNTKIGLNVETVAEVMIHLIQEKLRMPEGARDMVVLLHELDVEYPEEGNRKTRMTSTMIDYGEPAGFTAIAKSVGLPLAVATKLILTDRIVLTGCHIPTHPSIFEPVLHELRNLGFEWKEKEIPLPL
jgi:saccharopine dehydrogenase-like NADP-dependent oxidoreductase